MKARDVMVSPVISVKPSCTVKEVAQTLLERRISAVPVVDDTGKLVGIVSEGDLSTGRRSGPSGDTPGGCACLPETMRSPPSIPRRMLARLPT